MAKSPSNEINYCGMPEGWFPMKATLRRVLLSITTTPTPKAEPTSQALQTHLQRKWVLLTGYDPAAGRVGAATYVRTDKGQKALGIDDQVQKSRVLHVNKRND